MRSGTLSSLPLAAGLAIAVSSGALAQPVPLDPMSTSVGDARSVETAPRGFYEWDGIVSMSDHLENFPLGRLISSAPVFAAPTSFTGPPGFVWGMNSLSGQGNATSTVEWTGVVDLAQEPIGGTNTTRGVRIRTAIPQTPGGFFLGIRHTWPVVLGPDGETPVRVSADLYATSLGQLYSFEAVDTAITGFISSRLMWGGDCASRELDGINCATLAPDGDLNAFIFLSDCLLARCFTSQFWPGRYCATRRGDIVEGCEPPPFAKAGDIVRPAIGSWSRLGYEITPDGRRQQTIDFIDGTGEHVFAIDSWFIGSTNVNRLSINTSFEDADALLYIDNIAASGPGGVPLAQPDDEVCPFLNDINYLSEGVLPGQLQTALFGSEGSSTHPTALVVPRHNGAPGDLAIAIDPSETGGTQIREALLALTYFASAEDADIDFSVEIRHDNSRRREVALVSPNASLQGSTIVLSHPAEPRLQVVGDTGVVVLDAQWPDDGEYHTLRVRISNNGAIRVFIDEQRVGVATSVLSKPPGMSRVSFRSFRGGLFEIDNIAVGCGLASCAADVNTDDMIDFADLNAVLSNFGDTGESLPGDINLDGDVNFADLNAVLSAFGTSCE